jgi:hypothetical protein
MKNKTKKTEPRIPLIVKTNEPIAEYGPIPDVIAILETTRNAGNITYVHMQIDKALEILKKL